MSFRLGPGGFGARYQNTGAGNVAGSLAPDQMRRLSAEDLRVLRSTTRSKLPSLVEAAHPGAFDRADVHEDILATVLRPDLHCGECPGAATCTYGSNVTNPSLPLVGGISMRLSVDLRSLAAIPRMSRRSAGRSGAAGAGRWLGPLCVVRDAVDHSRHLWQRARRPVLTLR
jgi:hypothetical protein